MSGPGHCQWQSEAGHLATVRDAGARHLAHVQMQRVACVRAGRRRPTPHPHGSGVAAQTARSRRVRRGDIAVGFSRVVRTFRNSRATVARAVSQLTMHIKNSMRTRCDRMWGGLPRWWPDGRASYQTSRQRQGLLCVVEGHHPAAAGTQRVLEDAVRHEDEALERVIRARPRPQHLGLRRLGRTCRATHIPSIDSLFAGFPGDLNAQHAAAFHSPLGGRHAYQVTNPQSAPCKDSLVRRGTSGERRGRAREGV